MVSVWGLAEEEQQEEAKRLVKSKQSQGAGGGDGEKWFWLNWEGRIGREEEENQR